MEPSARKRILINWLILMVTVIGLGGAFWAYYRAVTARESDKKGQGRRFQFTVRTAQVERGNLTPTIRLQGDVVSRRTATIRAEVDGVVQSVPAREGQAVKAGDLLVRLDDRDRVLALRRHQALAMQAQATQARSQAGITKTRDLVTRLTKLDKDRLVSDEALQQARIDLTSAQASAAEARAQAALRHVELLTAKRDLERTQIKAPFSGRISKRYLEAGDRVAVGTSVVELVGGAGVELHLYVPVARVNLIRPGAKVRYRLASRKSRWQQGTIARVLPVADLASRNQTAVVALDEPPASYAPGLAVEARLGVGRVEGALIVDTDAITRFGEQWVVFRVNAGKAERVPVRILGEDDRRVAVGGGLKVGDEVVTVGNEVLFPRAPVRVVPTPRVAQRKAQP